MYVHADGYVYGKGRTRLTRRRRRHVRRELFANRNRESRCHAILNPQMRALTEADDTLTMTNMKQPTGYSIYNVEAKRRTKQNGMPTLYPDLPEKQFDIIYADPPWDYGGKLQFDKSSKAADKLDPKRTIFISSACFKYPTLKLSELVRIPVPQISKDDCLLFLWVTSPHLAQALTLGQAWGFEYRTVAFVWDKMCHNPGTYTLSNCELCLVFKRGRIPQPRGARNVQQLVRSPRRAHSMKPDEIRDAIAKMFPTQDRIELFARNTSDGWTSWGLDMIEREAENFRLASV